MSRFLPKIDALDMLAARNPLAFETTDKRAKQAALFQDYYGSALAKSTFQQAYLLRDDPIDLK